MQEGTSSGRPLGTGGVIACFSAGCDSSVIGQCTGYKRSCGRFYCSTHSRGTLCGECLLLKTSDEEAERRLQDYLATCDKLAKQTPGATSGTYVWAVVFLLGGMLAVATGKVPAGLGVMAFGVLSIVWGIRHRAKRRQMAESAALNRPGFAEFFEEWQRQKSKEAWAKAGAVVLIAGAVAGAAHAASDHMKNDAIRDKLKDEL